MGATMTPPFKVYRGVNQGDPLSPMIFIVVMDAVILHWVKVVAATEAGAEGLGVLIQVLAAYFYADNGIFVLTQPERLQRSFERLADLVDQVVLQTNMRNMVRLAC